LVGAWTFAAQNVFLYNYLITDTIFPENLTKFIVVLPAQLNVRIRPNCAPHAKGF
jgi:hypothetical protein